MSRSIKQLGFTALLALGAGCGGGFSLLNVQASEEEICQEEPEQSVEAAPIFAPHSLDTTFSYDLSSALASLSGSGLTTDVEFSTFTITGTEGVDDLSFITTAAITTAGADGGTQEILHYDRPQTGVVGKTINVNPVDGVNLLTLGQDGKLDAQIHFEGTLPTAAWKMQTKPCFKANVSYALKP